MKLTRTIILVITLFFITCLIPPACTNIPEADIESANAFREKMLNDPEAVGNAKASLVVIGSRTFDFGSLVQFAQMSSEGIKELAPSFAKIKKLNKLSENAKSATILAWESFNSILDGEPDAAASFGSTSNTLFNIFNEVDSKIDVGKDFVSSVDAYLENKEVKDNFSLALTRDLWAAYCAGQALLDGNNEDALYWSEKKPLVSDSIVSGFTTFSDMGALFSADKIFADVVSCMENNASFFRATSSDEPAFIDAYAFERNSSLNTEIYKLALARVHSFYYDQKSSDIIVIRSRARRPTSGITFAPERRTVISDAREIGNLNGMVTQYEACLDYVIEHNLGLNISGLLKTFE